MGESVVENGTAPRLALPPRPKTRLGLWQHLKATRANSVSTWSDAAFEMELGERHMLWRHVIIANAPEHVRHVLLDNAENYVRSSLSRRLLEPGLGQGLLTTHGATWRRQRRMMAPAFAAKRIADFAPAMVEAAERLAWDWSRVPPSAPVDLAEAMSGLTLAIISEAMFSVRVDPEIALIGQAVAVYQSAIRPSIADLIGLPDWLPRPAVRRAHRIFAESDRVIQRLIDERRRHGGPDDLLAMLLAAPDGEAPASAKEVRDHVATIFTAGHETTANALAWTFYLLSLHPAERRRLEDELDRVLGERAATAEDVPNLTFTRMVIEESMRLYPPAHTMSRQALGPDRLGTIELRKGSSVLIVPWLLHRHRKLWDRPDEFRPDRFAPAEVAARPRFAYIPFGAGPHICIGASFAMTEAILCLATIARRFRLTLVPGTTVEPVGLITLRPKHGLPMRLERR
ncbi:cytochrome P450 [Aliidongia dinghuensis]|nr:cytochrome P450 [Aliidongia dinghuensis]